MKNIDLEKEVEKITGVKMPKYAVVYVGMLEDEKILRLCIQKNCETPNNADIDEVVENYMRHNYPNKAYEILDDWIEDVVLNEKDIWEIPNEY